MEKPVAIRLHVLAPIHIGCDDVFEPTGFVIDETRKKLIEFDPMEFIKNLTLSERERFSKICSGDDLLQIFKFIKNTYKQDAVINEVNVATGLLEHYKKVLSMPSYNKNTIINQFTMNKTAYNPQTSFAYIPGTSLKGSLRTGYLSFLAINNGVRNVREKTALEKRLLGGSFASDPLRMIKVSDFQPLEGLKTKIIYGVNRKKKISDRPTKAENGPPQIFEAIEPGSIFEGAINIDRPEKGADIRNPVDKEILLPSVHRHYKKIYDQEMQAVKDRGFRHVAIDDFRESLGNTSFLIRIGRHSGAEAVTIEGNRNIRIMQGGDEKPKYLDYSTTVWLASETRKPTSDSALTPFGWAILEVVPFHPKKGIYPSTKPTRGVTTVPAYPEPQPMKPEKAEAKNVPLRPEPARTAWRGATLVWSPNNQTLSTTYEGKKAEIRMPDRSAVPAHFHKKLFEGKKRVVADIVVEPIGNAFRIVKIENTDITAV